MFRVLGLRPIGGSVGRTPRIRGSLIIMVYYAPKPYSNYPGPYIMGPRFVEAPNRV